MGSNGGCGKARYLTYPDNMACAHSGRPLAGMECATLLRSQYVAREQTCRRELVVRKPFNPAIMIAAHRRQRQRLKSLESFLGPHKQWGLVQSSAQGTGYVPVVTMQLITDG